MDKANENIDLDELNWLKEWRDKLAQKKVQGHISDYLRLEYILRWEAIDQFIKQKEKHDHESTA